MEIYLDNEDLIDLGCELVDTNLKIITEKKKNIFDKLASDKEWEKFMDDAEILMKSMMSQKVVKLLKNKFDLFNEFFS